MPAGPLRLLILRDHLVWSGGTIHFLELLPRLDVARIAAELCVLSDPAPEAAAFAAAGLAPRFQARRRRDPYALGRTLRLIGAARPHLLHLSGPRAMLVGRVAGALSGTPAVLWFNNALPEPGWQRAAQRRLAPWTAAGLAVSRATADWAAETYALPRDRIEVQLSAPDPGPFLAAGREGAGRVREALGIPRGARVIVLAGRVVDAQKGQIGMVETLPSILARVPEAHLLVVGEGPDMAALGARIAALGLAASVTLAGFRRDMPDLLAAADVAVVPSRVEEAFGYAAIEAAAAGLPVVAFRAGGLPEAVREGKTGFVAERGDWAGLADALCRCLTEDGLAARLGAAGRAFAAGFSKDAEAERFAAFHEAVAARVSAGGSP